MKGTEMDVRQMLVRMANKRGLELFTVNGETNQRVKRNGTCWLTAWKTKKKKTISYLTALTLAFVLSPIGSINGPLCLKLLSPLVASSSSSLAFCSAFLFRFLSFFFLFFPPLFCSSLLLSLHIVTERLIKGENKQQLKEKMAMAATWKWVNVCLLILTMLFIEAMATVQISENTRLAFLLCFCVKQRIGNLEFSFFWFCIGFQGFSHIVRFGLWIKSHCFDFEGN